MPTQVEVIRELTTYVYIWHNDTASPAKACSRDLKKMPAPPPLAAEEQQEDKEAEEEFVEEGSSGETSSMEFESDSGGSETSANGETNGETTKVSV